MNSYPHDDTTTERLWALATGTPDPEIEAHIATCDGCQAELATLRALSGYRATTGGTMGDPPAAVLSATTDLFRQVRPDLARAPESLGDRVGSALRRLTANLAFDSGTAALAGVRSEHDRQTRQFAFVSDLGDLDLLVTRSDGESEVSGQLGLDEIQPELVMHFTPVDADTDAEPIALSLPESGRFTVRLRHGEWVAWVRIGDAILEFPGVRV